MVLAENGLTEQALEMAVPVVLYDPRSKGPEFDGFSSKTEVTIEGEWPTWEDLEQGTLFKFGGSGREFVRAGKGYLPAGTGD
ncbi:MAG: hypothetical protein GWN18_07605, partial [Thermoplasmata archaeon]|nr:hypothetical protein [Thermoplasmata archaeon]NIT77030.1 hypothetical protein [Thermoplasmata archaeon]NIU48940.1 hypothetical protein [Thermoplasmata archaeon]NIV78603.1 hypothetical protein [Thermoplasmata archaeon]NIW82432.1 hypothetical protein [Thermoplasmata archaeon]